MEGLYIRIQKVCRWQSYLFKCIRLFFPSEKVKRYTSFISLMPAQLQHIYYQKPKKFLSNLYSSTLGTILSLLA